VTIDAQFDYVIVGAGTAGCVLAARLSEDRHTRVCLLEAGGPARHPFIQVPALVGAAITHRGLTWGLRTEPQTALNDRRIPLPRGKVIGGSATRRITTSGRPPAAPAGAGRRYCPTFECRKTMLTGATPACTASTDPSTSLSSRTPTA
jgi:choline dehydrogenase-like flavoprotein